MKNENKYSRPVRGCSNVGWGAAAGGELFCCLGLLTFVLLLANSSRIVCGMSGSNLTPFRFFRFCGVQRWWGDKKKKKDRWLNIRICIPVVCVCVCVSVFLKSTPSCNDTRKTISGIREFPVAPVPTQLTQIPLRYVFVISPRFSVPVCVWKTKERDEPRKTFRHTQSFGSQQLLLFSG